MALRQRGVAGETNSLLPNIRSRDTVQGAQGELHIRLGVKASALTNEDDMDSLGLESHSVDAQRPFKVFLSLLDKWELGAALSDKLVVPALEAIRAGLPRVSSNIREEVSSPAIARL